MTHNGSGVYCNDAKQQYEAWVVNARTGEERLIGALSYEHAQRFPESRKRWEAELWRRLLGVGKEAQQ